MLLLLLLSEEEELCGFSNTFGPAITGSGQENQQDIDTV